MCLRVTWMLGRGPTSRLLDVFSLPVVLAPRLAEARFDDPVREAVLTIAKGLNAYDKWNGEKGMRGEDGGRKKMGGLKRGVKRMKSRFLVYPSCEIAQERTGTIWMMR